LQLFTSPQGIAYNNAGFISEDSEEVAT